MCFVLVRRWLKVQGKEEREVYFCFRFGSDIWENDLSLLTY